jgi:hypothetical protein
VTVVVEFLRMSMFPRANWRAWVLIGECGVQMWDSVAALGEASKNCTPIFEGRLCNFGGIGLTYSALHSGRINGEFAR